MNTLPNVARERGSRRAASWLAVVLAILALPLFAQQPPQEVDLDVAPPSLVVGNPAGTALSGETLEKETERVSALVRCPVCQGLSVWDSPAPMAVKMRNQIRELLSEGYSEKQILSYFERSYGEFVLLEPPLRGINWLVWLAPVILLLIGIGVVWWLFRRARVTPASIEAEHAETTVAEETDPYLLEVRRLAYGDAEEMR